MFASSLSAAFSLLLATALADSSPYSKFIDDANSLLAAATGTDASQLNALYAWQATQTAVPSGDVDSQYQTYLDAYITTTSAPLPPWVTAVPSSLQSIATSFLQAEASLVIQDIAPIVSQNNVAFSMFSAGQVAPTTISLDTTAVSTSAPSATASSGFVGGPANITTSQLTGNGTAQTLPANGTAIAPITSIATAAGSPTRSVTPPQTTLSSSGTSGAEKPARVAAAVVAIGIMGIAVLL